MTQNKGVRVYIACSLAAIVFCLGGATGAALAPKQTTVTTYKDAMQVCADKGGQPWQVRSCQWDAYENFYGPGAAQAAWADAAIK